MRANQAGAARPGRRDSPIYVIGERHGRVERIGEPASAGLTTIADRATAHRPERGAPELNKASQRREWLRLTKEVTTSSCSTMASVAAPCSQAMISTAL